VLLQRTRAVVAPTLPTQAVNTQLHSAPPAQPTVS
jgi:hypothetical protein